MAVTDAEYRELRYRVEQLGRRTQELTRRLDANPARVQAANSTAQVSFTSTSYSTGTGGPEVTADIGASGKAIVQLTATLQTTINNTQIWMSYKVSGATTVAASDVRAIALAVGNNDLEGIQAGGSFLVTDLTPGDNVFTAMYKRATGAAGSTVQFLRRNLIVTPL